MRKRQETHYRISLKGLALIAAIETGLLPEIERDGELGYDDELFGRFWDMYNKLAEEQNNLFRKKREHR